MLRSAVEAASAEDGWARLSTVGSQIGNQASFDPRNYGYGKLSDLVEAIGLFQSRREHLNIWIRNPPKGGVAARSAPKEAATKAVTKTVAKAAKAAKKTAA